MERSLNKYGSLSNPFGEHAAFVLLREDDCIEFRLHPLEEEILSEHASEKRRKEFRLGRAAANAALKQLGFESPPPIGKGDAREPLWPEGILGSITHAGDLAICAVSFKTHFASFGIDLQFFEERRSTDITRHICHEEESRWVNGDTQRMISLFSAKESVYKAFYPLCRQFLGFRDVVLRWQTEREAFRGELLKNLNEDYQQGYFFTVARQVVEGAVFTSMALPVVE